MMVRNKAAVKRILEIRKKRTVSEKALRDQGLKGHKGRNVFGVLYVFYVLWVLGREMPFR
jgi:hypothetical protein